MVGHRATAETPADASSTPVVRLARTLFLSALVLLGVVLVLALAPVSHVAAGHLPLPPNDPTAIVAGATRPGTTAMRNLPVGLPAGVRIATTQDVYPYAVAALGVPGAQALMSVLSSLGDLTPYSSGGPFPAAFEYLYPYRYAALEPILDAAPPADLGRGATQLGAALIELAGVSPVGSRAAPAAYAVLDRTRSSTTASTGSRD